MTSSFSEGNTTTLNLHEGNPYHHGNGTVVCHNTCTLQDTHLYTSGYSSFSISSMRVPTPEPVPAYGAMSHDRSRVGHALHTSTHGVYHEEGLQVVTAFNSSAQGVCNLITVSRTIHLVANNPAQKGKLVGGGGRKGRREVGGLGGRGERVKRNYT